MSPSSSSSQLRDRSADVADNIHLPSMTRTTTNLSAISCSSTTELVSHSHSMKTTESSLGLGERVFPWTFRKERLRDSEGDPGLREKGGGNKDVPLKMWHGWQHVLGSWLNIFILLLPAAWVLMLAMDKSHTIVFIFCVLAMIPLVKLHDLATMELSARLGGPKTGLLNASLSNIVEIVVAIIALRECELRVVQASLVGSMLSKLLLVLGMCFLAGGMRFTEQDFDSTATQIHSSLLSISVGALLLPAAFHFALTSNKTDDAVAAATTLAEQKRDILKMSYGVSIVLLFIYVSYLLFQFWSHTHLFKDSTTASNKLPKAVSMRTLASRVRQKSGSMPTLRKIVKPAHLRDGRIQTSRPNVLTMPYGRSPYLYDSGRETPSASSSDTDTSPPASRTAFLISPYATTSQITFSDGNPSGNVAPGMDSTVRLVDESPLMLPREMEIEHPDSKRSKDDDRRSAVSEVVSVYLSDMGDVVEKPLRGSEGALVDVPLGELHEGEGECDDEGENVKPLPRQPQLSWTLTLGVLTVVTVLVTITAELLVDSMDELSPTISKEWIGLILLPTVGSIAECITAMNVSVKDRLTLSISVAVGSTIQTALFVIPFMVLLGWVIDKPLALLFDPFESVVLYISVHTMGYVVADGKSNWLEGIILVCLYVVIAVTFWFYPGSSFSSSLAVCSTSL